MQYRPVIRQQFETMQTCYLWVRFGSQLRAATSTVFEDSTQIIYSIINHPKSVCSCVFSFSLFVEIYSE
jgi:hypothetical protein